MYEMIYSHVFTSYESTYQITPRPSDPGVIWKEERRKQADIFTYKDRSDDQSLSILYALIIVFCAQKYNEQTLFEYVQNWCPNPPDPDAWCLQGI